MELVVGKLCSGELIWRHNPIHSHENGDRDEWTTEYLQMRMGETHRLLRLLLCIVFLYISRCSTD